MLAFPKITDPRGNLTFLQNPDQVPFPIARVFWTYDVPGGEIRGAHAYREQQEIIIALSGSFDLIVTDSSGNETSYSLNRSYFGLYLPARTWRRMQNFSTNALGLHLSSHGYAAGDYIRDFNEYRSVCQQ